MYSAIADATRLAAVIGPMNSESRDSLCLFVAEEHRSDTEELIAAEDVLDTLCSILQSTPKP